MGQDGIDHSHQEHPQQQWALEGPLNKQEKPSTASQVVHPSVSIALHLQSLNFSPGSVKLPMHMTKIVQQGHSTVS